jgi:hypothetical protein
LGVAGAAGACGAVATDWATEPTVVVAAEVTAATGLEATGVAALAVTVDVTPLPGTGTSARAPATPQAIPSVTTPRIAAIRTLPRRRSRKRRTLRKLKKPANATRSNTVPT